VSHHARGDSSDDRKRWDVAGHDGAGRYHGVLANPAWPQDSCACGYPSPFFDDYVSTLSRYSLISFRAELRVVVSAGYEVDVRAKECVLLDSDCSRARIEMSAVDSCGWMNCDACPIAKDRVAGSNTSLDITIHCACEYALDNRLCGQADRATSPTPPERGRIRGVCSVRGDLSKSSSNHRFAHTSSGNRSSAATASRLAVASLEPQRYSNPATTAAAEFHKKCTVPPQH
jgi:hypothetical protein